MAIAAADASTCEAVPAAKRTELPSASWVNPTRAC